MNDQELVYAIVRCGSYAAMTERSAVEDLEDRLHLVLTRWAHDPAVMEFFRRGYGIVVSPEQPPHAQALCDRALLTVVLYAPWVQPANDENLERVLRHEIAHALGFEHGQVMRELHLHD